MAGRYGKKSESPIYSIFLHKLLTKQLINIAQAILIHSLLCNFRGQYAVVVNGLHKLRRFVLNTKSGNEGESELKIKLCSISIQNYLIVFKYRAILYFKWQLTTPMGTISLGNVIVTPSVIAFHLAPDLYYVQPTVSCVGSNTLPTCSILIFLEFSGSHSWNQ